MRCLLRLNSTRLVGEAWHYLLAADPGKGFSATRLLPALPSKDRPRRLYELRPASLSMVEHCAVEL